jgi:hypothetical protein
MFLLLLCSLVSTITSSYNIGCCNAHGFLVKRPTMLLLLHSWLSRKTSCLLLLCSWLSNITSYCVLAAMLVAFQHNFRLRSCCYALDFPTQLPTTFLLLRSWLSNITSDYVSAATLLAFHHASVLLITYPYVVATLLDFQLSFLLCLLSLHSSLSNMTSIFPTQSGHARTRTCATKHVRWDVRLDARKNAG